MTTTATAPRSLDSLALAHGTALEVLFAAEQDCIETFGTTAYRFADTARTAARRAVNDARNAYLLARDGE